MKFLILALCVVVAAADPHWSELSTGEAKMVQDSWNMVKTQESDILFEIFKAHPDIQAKFPQFNGKELGAIKGSAAFATHATRIVSFLSQIISLLGHPEAQPAMKTLLNDMGHTHAGRGVTKDQFNEFKTTLVSYLKEHSSFGDNTGAAWYKAFDKFYYVIFSNLDGHPVA